eukprot:scaffold1284_cov108-Cylindrotheca_fusiformis.AAC.8
MTSIKDSNRLLVGTVHATAGDDEGYDMDEQDEEMSRATGAQNDEAGASKNINETVIMSSYLDDEDDSSDVEILRAPSKSKQQQEQQGRKAKRDGLQPRGEAAESNRGEPAAAGAKNSRAKKKNNSNRGTSHSASPTKRSIKRVSKPPAPPAATPKRGRKKKRSNSPCSNFNRAASFTPDPTTKTRASATDRMKFRSTSPQRQCKRAYSNDTLRPSSLPPRPNRGRTASRSKSPSSRRPIGRPSLERRHSSSLTPHERPIRKGRKKTRSVDPAMRRASPAAESQSADMSEQQQDTPTATRRSKRPASLSPTVPLSTQKRASEPLKRASRTPSLSPVRRTYSGGSSSSTRRPSLTPVRRTKSGSSSSPRRPSLTPVRRTKSGGSPPNQKRASEPLKKKGGGGIGGPRLSSISPRPFARTNSKSPKRSSLSPIPTRPSSEEIRRSPRRRISISPNPKKPRSDELPRPASTLKRETVRRSRSDGSAEEPVRSNANNNSSSSPPSTSQQGRKQPLQSILSEETLVATSPVASKSPFTRILSVDFTGKVADHSNKLLNAAAPKLLPRNLSVFSLFRSTSDETPPTSGFSTDDENMKSHRRNPSSEIVFDTSLLGVGIDEHIQTSRNSRTKDPHSNNNNGKTEASGPSGEATYSHEILLPKPKKTGSARSLFTVELEFEGDSKFIQALRYIRLLAPYRNEPPIERRVRMFTWGALFCDFLAALVSITTFRGVSMCCGRAILSIMGNANWNKIIEVFTYIYMIMIVIEIIPVVRDGLPFNILNPLVGFIITFAVFFDDNVAEAVCMWVIEIIAITCEFMTYRLKNRIYLEKEERIKETDKEFQEFKEFKKARKKAQRDAKKERLNRNGLSPIRQKTASTLGIDSLNTSMRTETTASVAFRKPLPLRKASMASIRQNSSRAAEINDCDDSQGSSIIEEEEQEEDIEAGRFTPSREIRIMRRLRLWRQEQEEQLKHLRYLFAGVAFNIGLVVFTLLLIIMISKNRGLCVVDMTTPAIFASGQLDKCFDCVGVKGTCEVCRDDGTSHCYYPYY